jgi:hypothetical protein
MEGLGKHRDLTGRIVCQLKELQEGQALEIPYLRWEAWNLPI